MNIGQAIKKIRTEKGLLQGALAKKCGISQTSLYQIEVGKKRPSAKTLELLSKHLETPEAIFYLYSLNSSDVPKEKKEIFDMLFPTVQEMIMKLVVKD